MDQNTVKFLNTVLDLFLLAELISQEEKPGFDEDSTTADQAFEYNRAGLRLRLSIEPGEKVLELVVWPIADGDYKTEGGHHDRGVGVISRDMGKTWELLPGFLNPEDGENEVYYNDPAGKMVVMLWRKISEFTIDGEMEELLEQYRTTINVIALIAVITGFFVWLPADDG